MGPYRLHHLPPPIADRQPRAARKAMPMYLHVRIPGFHAAVHQAASTRLRGRPVAVAVDGNDQAPLFATSVEARRQGVWPGLRAAAARRRCPGLHVVTPEPDLYRRAEAAVERLC